MSRIVLLPVLTLAACIRAGFDATDSSQDSDQISDEDSIDSGDASCVLLLHMDEGSWSGVAGEVADACGGNSGRAVGTVTTTAGGKFGRAASISAAGWVQVDDVPELELSTALTISVWVSPTSLSPPQGFVGKRISYDTDYAYGLFMNGLGQLKGDVDGYDDRLGGVSALQPNTWQHVAMTYDATRPPGQQTRLYLDGVLDAEGPETSSSIPGYTSPLTVGCLLDSTGNVNFDGLIDEVAIWSRALSDEEVAALAAATGPLQ